MADQSGAAASWSGEDARRSRSITGRLTMVADASRMAGSQTDITEGKVSDPLTGLPNRLLFIDRVGRLIKHSKRRKDQLFAVLFMDLDGFKMINDSMGHLIGDQLLLGVAGRLETVGLLAAADPG